MRENRRILAVELQKQLDDAASKIIAKVIEMAQESNLAALRLCIERILPPLKARSLSEPEPLPETSDCRKAYRTILCQMSMVSSKHCLEAVSSLENVSTLLGTPARALN